MREEEDAKLLCEKAVTIQDRLAWRSGSPVRKPNAGAGSGKRPGLYLRIPSRQGREMEKAQNLLEIFEGTTPVYVFFQDTQKVGLAPRSMWVFPNDVLLGQLTEILGEGNVKLVE